MITPRISVIMPVYNCEVYLGAAINSILNQSFADFELIIINDGSTDSSSNIVDSYNDPRIVSLRSFENQGVSWARNKGLFSARGMYIAFLDADDIALPKRLETQVKFLNNNPRIGLCGTWVRVLQSNDEIWRYPTDPRILRARMLFDDPIATSSVMLKKEALPLDKKYFNSCYDGAEDYELWERISRRWEMSNVPMVLTLYRKHQHQISSTQANKIQSHVKGIQRRLLQQLSINPTANEMQLHLDIGVGWNFKPVSSVTSATRDWLYKLHLANKSMSLFPKTAFKKILADRWYLQVRSSMTGNQFNVIITYLGLGLWHISFLTIYRLMRLIFESIKK